MEFFDADTCVLLQPDKERTQWARAVGFSRRSFKWCTRLSGVHRDQGSSAGAGAFLTSIYTTNRYIGGRHPKYLISDPEAPVTVERPVSEASVWQEWLRDDGVRMRHDYFRAGRHLLHAGHDHLLTQIDYGNVSIVLRPVNGSWREFACDLGIDKHFSWILRYACRARCRRPERLPRTQTAHYLSRHNCVSPSPQLRHVCTIRPAAATRPFIY